MYQKQKPKIYPTKHPHFVQEIGDGITILSDAPQIKSELDPDMFSLTVNKLNKQNLQPVSTELSNRLDAVHALEREAKTLENSINDYQQQQKTLADTKKFEEMFNSDN